VNNKREIALNAIRQYWERLFSRLKPSRQGGRHAIAQDEPARDFPGISDGNHDPAAEMRRVHADIENARDEENDKIVDLEQVRQAVQLVREEDQRKLAELESINDRHATAWEADHRRISDLEGRVFELDDARRQAHDRIQELENTLAEATNRLERTDRQIKELQRNTVEQSKQFQASIADASSRLAETDNQLRVLGTRLEDDRRQVLKTFETLQGRLRAQDVRLNWTIAAASFAVLLGTTAAGVLILDVQKNSTVLAGMSRDIKEMMGSVSGQTGLIPGSALKQRQPAQPATSPDKRDAAIGKPADSPTATTRSATPATGAAASVPDLPYSTPESSRGVSRLGIQQATREDAKRFFEDNGTNEGMISLPSGVQYRLVKSGSGRSPSLTDQVVVSYVGMKPDGTVFDETYSSRAPVTFSMNELIPGWREVLLKMQEGAEFELYVPPNLATSKSARKRSMLGYDPSIYLIELLQVVNADATTAPSTPAE